VVAVLFAVVAACSSGAPAEAGKPAPGLGVYVPLVWKTDRLVSGHAKHVVEEHMQCAQCHALTGDSMGAVSPMRCAECHAKQGKFLHAHAEAQAKFGSEVSTDCTTCHAFTAGDAEHTGAVALANVLAPTACARCHASQGSDAPQVATHATTACITCHRPHENGAPQVTSCLTCHEGIATNHASTGKTPSEVCTTCHVHQHAPASDAILTCATCHATEKPIIPATATFAGGHTECVGCHRPHDFMSASAVPCRSCHESIHVLAAPLVPAHARCESCHSPHDVRAAGDAVCITCHENVHPDHPKTTNSCIGCHDPHPKAITAAIARPCSGCHQIATSDHAFHGGVACPACHVPHEFALDLSKRTDLTLCKGCHTKQVTLASTNAGHEKCQDCHQGLPHQPTNVEVPCATCHAAVVAVATKGHSECIQCHEPHGGAFVAQCKDCHSAEQRTAPLGHQACTNCHDQHSGAQKVSCAACHATEAASAHGKIAGGCADCHRPHGPDGIATPPPCATCHDPAKLPGLHSIPKHEECRDCHSGHDAGAEPKRAPCLTCHADKKSHFPDAPSCTSCHLFGPTK
jgi:hypothetical protein